MKFWSLLMVTMGSSSSSNGDGGNGRVSVAMGGGEATIIRRQMEKRRIREEIMSREEVLRRRGLDGQLVMYEKMVEREMILREREREILLNSSRSCGNSDSWRLNFHLRDRLALQEKFSLNNWIGNGGIYRRFSAVRLSEDYGGIHDRMPPLSNSAKEHSCRRRLSSSIRQQCGSLGELFPIQRNPRASSSVALKPVIDLSRKRSPPSVKRIDANAAGTKPKFDGIVLASSCKRKMPKEWTCDLCQVRATCEQGLKDHMKGKKHRAKEKAGLQTETGNLSGESNLLPEITEKPVILCLPASCTNSKEIDNGARDLKMEAINTDQQEADDLEPIDGKTHYSVFKFSCLTCNVGTNNEALMEAHCAGKKHRALYKKNCGGVMCIRTAPEMAQHLEAGRREAEEILPANGDFDKSKVDDIATNPE